MKKLLLIIILTVIIFFNAVAQPASLNILAIGAHPDDCDVKFAGTAALFAKMGHNVKFLSIANGDAGHMNEGGGILAKRRNKESKAASEILNVSYEIMDYHDGEIMPTLELRMKIIQQIREWNADIVITHRPGDYHPDHRYVSQVVQDAAFMVEVPNCLPGVPALRKTPLFLFFKDHFKTPRPFRPDIVIDITEVLDKKINSLSCYESQFYEWLPWVSRYEVNLPAEPEARKEWLKEWVLKHPRWSPAVTPELKQSLRKWYGKKNYQKIKYAEAFEICEFGLQPYDNDIRKFFPMLDHDQISGF